MRRLIFAAATMAVGAAVVVGPSAAAVRAAAAHQQANFSLIAERGGPATAAEITAHGPNRVLVDWSAFGLTEFLDSDTLSLCCDAHLALFWNWSTKAHMGSVSGTFSTTHYFLPIHWEGELHGQMTAGGGSGVIHLTETYSGQKLIGTWTMPPVDPLADTFLTLTVSGTLVD